VGTSYAIPAQIVRSGAERATLVRRTYALVFTGILVTIAGAAFSATQVSILQAVIQHPFIAALLMFAPLMAARASYRSFPANIGFVYLFTFMMGIFLAPTLLYYARVQPGVLGEAGLLTGTAFGALTMYAFVSRRDFSAWGSFFFTGLIVLIVAGVLNLFLHSAGIQLWIAGATVLVFSGLLVFDTWRIRNVFGPDDYVLAAVRIYLDLLNLFLAILRLLGGRRSS
jgi:FtsH-binding integral membrane protein